MLVALARARRRAAVVEARPAGLADDRRQRSEVAARHRQQLLLKAAPRQHQMTIAQRKLVQNHHMLFTQRADGQFGIRIQERIEIRVARPPGNGDLGRILDRQRRHPANDETHAGILHLDLLHLNRLQVTRSQRTRAALVYRVHPRACHDTRSP